MKKTTTEISLKAEYRLYILMRNDLASLNAGKAMAQAAHAANHLTAEWGECDEVKEYSSRGNPFGTAIVLAVNQETLLERLKLFQSMDYEVPWGAVWDTTYPFNTTTEIAALIPKGKLTAPTIVKEDGRATCFRNEITCGYVLVNAIEAFKLVGGLPLHP